jgi:hypothetical protein
MSFVATSSDHLKEIRCDVNVRDLTRTMHGSLTLEVKCKLSALVFVYFLENYILFNNF